MAKLATFRRKMHQTELNRDVEELLLEIGHLEERLAWTTDEAQKKNFSEKLVGLRRRLLDLKEEGKSKTLPHLGRVSSPDTSGSSPPSEEIPSFRKSSPSLASKSNSESMRIPEKKIAVGETARFRWSAETIASTLHPDRNEDRWLVVKQANGAGVFDGISKARNAAEASKKAADDVEQAFNALRPTTPAEQLPEVIAAILLETNNLLGRLKQTTGEELATTAAIALITEDNGKPALAFGTVGDSRIGVYKKNTDRYELLTLDDTLLRLLLEPPETRQSWLAPILKNNGLNENLILKPEEAAELTAVLDLHSDPASLSPMLKFLFNERNVVTQSLSGRPIIPHTGLTDLASGDRVLIASDGLHDNLTEGELIQILKNTALDETASALVVRAHEVSRSNSPRAKGDDITAVVMEIL